MPWSCIGCCASRGTVIGLRTVQRAVAPVRQAQRAADVATVRVETAPGAQMQVDFGEKRVTIAGTAVKVFLLVAVLSYSRRTFVKAFLHERQDDWREGIASAFMHFGGVVLTVLGDNARALVRGRDRATGTVTLPARVSGVLSRLGRAAARVRPVSGAHQRQGGVRREIRQAQCAGGTHLRLVRGTRAASGPVDGRGRSARAWHDARAALRPFRTAMSRPPCVRCRRVRCLGVSSDCAGASPAMRSSTWRRCATASRISSCAITSTSRSTRQTVRIFHGADLVATHPRSREPFAQRGGARRIWPGSVAGRGEPPRRVDDTLSAMGRSLAEYAAVVGGR